MELTVRNLLWTVGLHAFVYSLSTACDVNKSPFCLDVCDGNNNILEISCEPGIISYLNISADDLECGMLGGCPGLTSDMLVTKNSCYWQPKCNLRRPNRRPKDIIVKADDMKCHGRLANHLQLHEYRCFDPDPPGSNPKISKVLDMMSSSTNYCEKLYLKDGILRSHSEYPWQYSTIKKKTICKSMVKKLGLLVITVQDMDLGEGDNLTLTIKTIREPHPKPEELSQWKPGSSKAFPIQLASLIDIKFQVTAGVSNGGRGFIICFMQVDASDSTTDACKAVTMPGIQGIPAYVSDEPMFWPLRPPGLGTPTGPDPQTSTSGKLTRGECKELKKRCKKNKQRKERKKCMKEYKKGCRTKKRKKGRKPKTAKKNKKDA